MKKLNLGCGLDIRKDWTNLDIHKLKGVDVVHDLNKFPYPFKNESYDYILCNDILEHLDCINALKEMHRILKKNGSVKIRVPHFTSTHNFEDPTHVKLFATRYFKFFISEMGRDYYFDFTFSEIKNIKITFEKGFMFWNYLIEPVVNINNKFRLLYEFTFLSRLFPADNIEIELIK